jgi:hypothetical protein
MIHRHLQPHLEPIARDFRRRFFWGRLAWFWAAGAGVGILFLLLRRHEGWSWPWTFPVLLIYGLMAAVGGIWAFRSLSIDYRALARMIERENPQLHAVLLTAVEQQPATPGGELNFLQQRVIEEALEHHKSSPWGRRMSERLRVARGAQWVALAVFALVLMGLSPRAPRPGELWVDAERSGSVAVTPGDTRIERGSGLVVMARFDGKLPVEAELVVTPVNEPTRRIALAKNLADPVFGGGIPEVKGDLKYHIEFPTGKTRDFKVSVFDYPKLDRADAHITYPTYTKLPEKTIEDTRRVSAVEGSSLDYTFHLNKAVTSARLVAKDKSAVTLSGDTNNSTIYHTHLTIDQSRRYELVLIDDAGRTNKMPPEFVFQALTNQAPLVKLTSPRGDQRVTALEEIAFQGEASDDFGLRSYGISYSLGGGESKSIELGHDSGPHEKRSLNYLLPMESLGAQEDQLLSYYVWADDVGPDGAVRRTSGDMFFAEVRPFDEIYRQGQQADQNSQGQSQSGQQNSPSEKLAELQRQITSATWNLQRRELASKPSAKYKDDVKVIRESQQQALSQARTMEENMDDPRMKGFVDTAAKAMDRAAGHLSDATDKNSTSPLPSAVKEEQAASQALLRLQAREYQVARNSRNQRGSSRGGQRGQQQLEQLDLKDSENRYETQSQASPTQTPEQREQLQVANRLKELAQRQQDMNERIKELQSALQEAKTEQERAEIQDRLKRLREEQQDLLADVDELRQRMDRPENQSRMAEERNRLDQTRSEVQRAADALNQSSVPQALASGTRAQRDLQQLQDDFRKKNSGQFSEQMRQMRDQARQMSQNEENISKKMDQLADPQQKSLSDTEERHALADQLTQQKNSVSNIFDSMRQISEQSETAEPLLSKQLYDMIRQNKEDETDKSLDSTSELVRRGFVSQATQFEQRARQGINELKTGIEKAAQSVLGDDTEALRLARRELENISQELDKEMAQSAAERGTNQAAGPGGTPENQSASNQAPGTNATERAGAQPGTQGDASQSNRSGQQSDQQANAQSNQQANSAGSQNQPGGSRSGDSQSSGQQGNENQGNAQANGNGGQRGNQQDAQANGGSQPGTENATDGSTRAGNLNQNGGSRNGGAGPWIGGAWTGPLVGEDYVNWSDRLRNVEEMVDFQDVRTEVARIRDRARMIRLDYKRLGKRPDWAVVKLQIAEPLAEVRSRITEELARRESKEALVPLDRDPVPARYSELVRHYYEELGRSDSPPSEPGPAK